MTSIAAPAEASASPSALAAVMDAALAARDEATRLLAALAEISTPAGIGPIWPHVSAAFGQVTQNRPLVQDRHRAFLLRIAFR